MRLMHARRMVIWAGALWLSIAALAEAHFVWVAIEKDRDGSPVARVWFSELAEPDNAELLDRIARVEVWAMRPSQSPQKLSLSKLVEGEGGCLTAPLPADATSLAATLCYGVVTRGGGPMLLHYHARYLDSASLDKPATIREGLSLQIVPRPVADGWELQVLFQGQPAAGSEVVTFDPAARETKVKTDAEGRVRLTRTKAGLYSIRARWAWDESGTHEGKPYQQVVHYATLALRDAEDGVPAATSASSDRTSAAALLRKARAARAEWKDFPGFEADLTLTTSGRQQTGKVRVDARGEVELQGFHDADVRQVRGILRSLVAHRMPEREEDDRVSFASPQEPHPLGELIRLDYDSVMASTYRIDGDVIREVNRKTQDGRFTISVLQVHRNSEGKYLPMFYVVNTWKADGTLSSSTAVHQTWTRVGAFDLPAMYETVTAGSQEHRTLSLTFRNVRLLP